MRNAPECEPWRSPAQESGQAGPVAWWLWIDASNWVLPEANDAKLRAFVNAWGTPQQVTLEQVYAQLGQSYVYGDGTYVYNVPKPLDVGLHVRRSRLRWPGATNGYFTDSSTAMPI